MIQLGIHGSLGRMGQRISLVILDDKDCQLACALEYKDHPDYGRDYGPFLARELDVKVGGEIAEGTAVVIDFSSPAGTMAVLAQCLEKRVALVSGTTGLSDSQMEKLKTASSEIPLLHATNMSLGINLLRKLVRETASALGEDFDIELVELHHHHKVDAPSGTCITLYEDICQSLNLDPKEAGVYGRKGKTGKRTPKEIGLHALRLGGVVGEHQVYFCSESERIELKHQAQSRDVFARGAVRAAKWISKKEKGFYSMEDVLFGG